MPQLKSRTYTIEQANYFCPNCHRQVDLPFKGLTLASNTIQVACACRGGQIVLKIPGSGKEAELPPESRITRLKYCPTCKDEMAHSFIKDSKELVCENCYKGAEPLEN